MKGIIKKLDERGFGFITLAGQKDIFFHANDCTNSNFKDMKEGDSVSFETASSDKGPKAVNVVLDNGMDDESAPESDETDESEAA
ncbi:MAG: cold shock domain-containing protein [Candidatus Gracilibacteria bacterium]